MQKSTNTTEKRERATLENLGQNLAKQTRYIDTNVIEADT